MIGCDCRVCTSPDPRDQRSRASIYVETPEAAWVIDTGPDFRMQALRERVRRVDAVVYTHAHTDHIMGFDDLRTFCHGGRDLPIHASPETMGDLERVFQFAFNGQNRWPGYVRPEPHVIDGPFTLGACKVVPDSGIERIRGVRHLIVDALRHQPHPTHMNVTEALALVEKVQPGQTWFTHLCHDLMHAEIEPTLPAGVRVAYDGLKIET